MSFCPLHWSTSVGGHVFSGETYKQAALRECREELGKKVKIAFAYKDLYHVGDSGLKKFLVTFKSKDNGPFRVNRKEVKEIRFFNLKEIQSMIDKGKKFHPELLFLLRKHFDIR